MYNKSAFQEQLKTLISQRGLTQRIVAEKMDTTETTISRYVSGDRTPNLETLVALAQVLNVSLDDLTGMDPPSKPRQAPDISILISCYQRASDADRGVIWAVFDRYMTPEQRAVITSIQAEEKAEAV